MAGLRDHLGDTPWLVSEDHFDPLRANVFETLLTVGNGYLGTRGTLEEGHLGEVSGTYLAGVYDDHDAPVIDLVNAPDWLSVAVFVDGVRLDVRNCTVLDHERSLDLRSGLMYRCTRFEDDAGRRTLLQTLRCASAAEPGACALRVEVTTENHASRVVVRTAVDGRRRNLERLPVYPEGTTFPADVRWEKWARTKHLDRTGRGVEGDVLFLRMRTVSSGIDIGYAFTVTCGTPPDGPPTTQVHDEVVSRRDAFRMSPGETLRLDKLVAIRTSRDPDADGRSVHERSVTAAKALQRRGFDAAVTASRAVWEDRWDDCDVVVDGDPQSTLAARFAIYHLLIAANPADPTVNIGAKSLSGEGYRGHVFWDTEILMLPFFIHTRPQTARSLLAYRHHTLDGARRNAREAGLPGARYAWESADTGREECPRTTPDGSFRFWARDEELHVSADVAYGIMRYVEATGDQEFLASHGAEILFETSRFWAARVERTDAGRGYALRTVMGPDEFHSHVDDNTFTNQLVRWHLDTAARLHDHLRATDPQRYGTLARVLGLDPAEARQWRDVAAGLGSPAPRSDGLVEQFAGYFDRHDVAVTEWDLNDMPRYPAGYHHFNCEDTQLLKQPDVIMLMYLLPDLYDAATKRANFEYYEARTLHKSSLSPAIHAIMGIDVGDTSRAEQYFRRSALVDLTDNQGNTDEGIHIASAGGTWQTLVCGFGGFRVVHGRMSFRPWLPGHWDGLRFSLRWHGAKVEVDVRHDVLGLTLRARPEDWLEVLVHGVAVRLTPGVAVRVPLPEPVVDLAAARESRVT